MPAPSRYLFVGGLHRSGTSLLAACVEGHPDVRGFVAPPVPEAEGVFLQGAIPHDATAGIPGRFADEEGSHLTEGGRFDTAEVRDRLRSDWEPWFAPGGTWRIEKSPVNLLRARLYQQLFPACQFVFVVRHPLAVARATAKWSDRGEAALIGHWDRAHEILLGDLPRLHNWLVVRFEDFCAAPERELARIFAFMELEPCPPARDVRPDLNEPYFAEGPAAANSRMAGRFGYAMDAPEPVGRGELRGAHWFRSVRERIA